VVKLIDKSRDEYVVKESYHIKDHHKHFIVTH